MCRTLHHINIEEEPAVINEADFITRSLGSSSDKQSTDSDFDKDENVS